MSATLKTIAERLNVSTMTISRAINNHPDIKKETREEVLALVRELNYQPNVLARSLFQKKTYAIGVVIPSIKHSFFPDITKGIEEAANKNGYNIILSCSGERYRKEASQIEALLQRRVDGLIVAPSQDTDKIDIYLQLIEGKTPFVFVDRYFDKLKTSCVICDDRKGGYLATTYLIGLRHRRIGHIAGPPRASTSFGRLSGYRQALEENNISPIIKGNGFEEEDGCNAMREFLGMSKPPTAIFAVTDLAAIGAMKAMEEKKIKVPDNISIVGFSDIELASLIKIPLTTIAQPKYELGKRAIQLLFKTIESEKEIKTKKIVLEPELVIRGSCKRR